MSTRRIANNTTVFYIIAVAVIVVAFLLLGGGPWLKGLTHGVHSRGMSNLNWATILIGAGLGFLLGLVVGKRKW